MKSAGGKSLDCEIALRHDETQFYFCEGDRFLSLAGLHTALRSPGPLLRGGERLKNLGRWFRETVGLDDTKDRGHGNPRDQHEEGDHYEDLHEGEARPAIFHRDE